jgi:KUP system potassium uptake protein
MTAPSPQKTKPPKPAAILALTALGVVFGDLGTSPLYTLQAVVGATGGHFTAASALGVLSLIVWTLIITISVKYALFVMRADNDGEGGILALMSLVGGDSLRGKTALLAVLGLAGAALIYGDGVITPSISVLSALEGLDLAAPGLKAYVMPAAVAVLAILFASQRFGSGKIGSAFGPVMLVWFCVIGVLGASGVVRHPEVIQALNPLFALRFLATSGWAAVGVLGGVFLCITGGEALYADMGHFGRGPIRFGWYVVVLPALLLDYAGQTGLLLQSGQVQGNPFYQLAPHWALWPLIALATAATIIASQAIITGSFSMTRQAMQLGWLPGFDIRQTSDDMYGQIYVPVINGLMAAATIAITIGFKTSDALAGAYGTAVSTTMLMTTALLFVAMRKCWRWPLAGALAAAAVFLVVDLAYFLANLAKIAAGGWLPLTLGAVIFVIMIVWRKGRDELVHVVARRHVARNRAMKALRGGTIPRQPGTAIFLSRPHRKVAPVVLDHIIRMGALRQQVLVVSVDFEQIPRMRRDDCITVRPIEAGVTAVTIRFGFVEIPNIPTALARAKGLDPEVRLDKAVYFAPRDRVVAKPRPLGLTRARLALFVFLFRNAVRAVDRFRLPSRQVVEIGQEIEV